MTFARDDGPAAAVSRGHAVLEIQPGLILQLVDLRTEGAMSQQAAIPPSLQLALLLEGRTELRFARMHYHFDAGRLGARPPQPRMTVFSATEPVDFSRRVEADTRLRHLSIQASPDWLERNGLGRYRAAAPQLRQGDASALPHGSPSAESMFLAEQLFAARQAATPLARLHRESKVLEMLCHVLRPFEAAPHRDVTDARMLRRLYAVRDWLESESSRAITMGNLVREFGMGADTLQRGFREVFGTTVFAYLQEHRLQRARRALEGGAPVSVAAYEAGYGSPANFSTAFRRRFGIAPKFVRAGRGRARGPAAD